MSMYAIQDTTLTALGDAVRSKAGKIVEEINNFFIGTSYFTIASNSSASKYRFIINANEDIPSSEILRVYEGSSSGKLIFSGYLENGVLPLTIETTSPTLAVIMFASNGRTFNITIIPLDENGNEFKYTPLEMVDEINRLNMNPAILLPKIISRADAPFYSITKEDFGDITKIGVNAFYMASGLNSIELPDTLQEIAESGCFGTAITEITFPVSLNKLGNICFRNCSLLHTVRILNDTSVITCPKDSYNDPFRGCPKLTSIYIPSKLYNAYYSDAYWSKYIDKFIAVGEWAFDPKVNPTLLFNQSVEVSIQLQSFANTPEFSITSSNEAVATISNVSINEDNTLLTYTINSLAVEGSSTITVNIVGGNNTYTFTNNVRVFEIIPEPTYEIIPQVDGATYGFALREDGYWESQNFKKGNSVAVCQVNISNMKGVPVYFDCINYAEANYDYCLLGAVNQVLGKTNSDDSGVKKNFKELSKADIQTVEYTDATGDCFIQVKFKKDSSGDQNNDSIRFKVRFGE